MREIKNEVKDQSVSRPGLDVGRVVSPVEPSRVFHHPEQVVPDGLEAGGDVVVRH